MIIFIFFIIPVAIGHLGFEGYGNHQGNHYHSNHNKILLKDITALTLYKNRMTNFRRVSALPQLKCIGGSAGCQWQPEIVQCLNSGFDGNDVQWKCEAKLNPNVKFGYMSVSCEGYDYPNDPYVLTGSCALEYKLESSSSSSYNKYGIPKKSGETWKYLSLLMIILIIIYIYNNYINNNNNRRRGGRGGGGGGWPGGDDGDDNDPNPPPYGFKNSSSYSSSPPPYSTSGSSNTYSSSSSSSSPFGGFWTGAGLGGLAGYFLGSRNNRGHRFDDYYSGNQGYFSDFDSSSSDNHYSNFGSSSSSGFAETNRR